MEKVELSQQADETTGNKYNWQQGVVVCLAQCHTGGSTIWTQFRGAESP